MKAELIDFVKVMFKRMTPLEAITVELMEAEHQLLRAETGVEYAQALVTYNKNRVKRLKAYLTVPTEEKSA
jgi:hypothetical protein